jgi:hypothetical protein
VDTRCRGSHERRIRSSYRSEERSNSALSRGHDAGTLPRDAPRGKVRRSVNAKHVIWAFKVGIAATSLYVVAKKFPKGSKAKS